MPHLLIFGLGFTASRIAAALRQKSWTIDATGRSGTIDFADERKVRAVLARATHVLSSVPPAGGSDPVLDAYGDAISQDWLGYLSSTGVYGDTQGAWVDESAEIGAGRRTVRAQCDRRWLNRRAHVFRLPGIYGPGRSALDRVRADTAKRIDLPAQVFSRIHVDDIVSGVVAGLAGPAGAYNLADDLPCSQNAVIEEACRLLDHQPPPLQTLEEAGLSQMAKGFYSENRRIANGKAKRVLGWRPRYADYRSGLRSLTQDPVPRPES